MTDLCEMKYSKDEYSITGKYAEKIRTRESCFRISVKTKKALRCTFVTTYGIKANENSSIVDNQIRAEDLFT